MNDLQLHHLDASCVWHPFDWAEGVALPLIERAEAAWLYASDGRKYLDAISSWWVNLHGHAHPSIAKAVAHQAQMLEHVIFSGFTHRPAIELATRLLDASGMEGGKVFYSDNGSTAVEVALKMAMQWAYITGAKRNKVIAIEGAYHGDTFGAMSVGGRGTFSVPFEPFLFDVEFIPFPSEENAETSLAVMRQHCNEHTLCFIYEPLVQGSAGMRMYSPLVLSELMRLARQCGALCVADEVMTGFGRTGPLMASNLSNLRPNLLCLSKGITGGFMPLGATLCSGEVHNVFEQGTGRLDRMFLHGHSYTANPLACAAALASFKITTSESCMADRERINISHLNFITRYRSVFPEGTKTRVCGTILAIEYPSSGGYADSLRHRLYAHHMANGILLRPLGNVSYVLPPYCITNEELELIYQSILGFEL